LPCSKKELARFHNSSKVSDYVHLSRDGEISVLHL
jgi:hypothetical protein